MLDFSKQLASSGYEVVVLAPHAPNALEKERMDGVRVLRFRYFIPKYQKLCYGSGMLPNFEKSILAKMEVPFFTLFQLVSLASCCFQEKPDIVHAWWAIPNGAACAILKQVFGFKLVCSVLGSDINSLENPVFRKIQKLVLSSCNKVVAISSDLQSTVVDKIGIKKKNVELIPLGVDERIFKRQKTTIRKNFKVHSTDRLILSVGRLVSFKGVQYLIKAMPLLLKKVPNSLLLIVGDGSQKRELVKLTRQMRLQERVKFAGLVAHEKLPRYYSSSDVFVLPSTTNRFKEGLGLVLAEAAMCKTPIIASRVGGILDLIHDGSTGVLVPEKDPEEIAAALTKVLTNHKLSKRMSEAAYKKMRNEYSLKAVTTKASKMYESIG